VRAKNLFRIVAVSCGELSASSFGNTFVFEEGSTPNNYIGFNNNVTVDDVSFTKGQIVNLDDIDSEVWDELLALYLDKFYFCIGYADEVNIVNRPSSQSSAGYLYIPRSQDVDGKTIIIHHTGNNITVSIDVRQIDYTGNDGGYAGNNPFYAGISITRDAQTGQGVFSMTNAQPYIGINSGETIVLHSFGSYWAVLARY
jgi:hypothetical protein